MPTVLRAARTGDQVPLTGPGRRRDWIHVDDVVEACLAAAAAAAAAGRLACGQVLNVGTGRHVANEELVAMAARVTGRPISTVPGGHPGRAWDTASWVCDPRLAGELLGWRATIPLEEGLARCWASTTSDAPATEDTAATGTADAVAATAGTGWGRPPR